MRKTTATPFSRMACANVANSMQVSTTRECASIVFRIFGAEWIGLNMANDKLINYNSCENAALTRIHIRKRSTTAALMGHKSSISSKFKIVISFRLHSCCGKHTAHGETYASFVSNFQRLVAPSLDCTNHHVCFCCRLTVAQLWFGAQKYDIFFISIFIFIYFVFISLWQIFLCILWIYGLGTRSIIVFAAQHMISFWDFSRKRMEIEWTVTATANNNDQMTMNQ